MGGGRRREKMMKGYTVSCIVHNEISDEHDNHQVSEGIACYGQVLISLELGP